VNDQHENWIRLFRHIKGNLIILRDIVNIEQKPKKRIATIWKSR